MVHEKEGAVVTFDSEFCSVASASYDVGVVEGC
jgi:hypothetical protein